MFYKLPPRRNPTENNSGKPSNFSVSGGVPGPPQTFRSFHGDLFGKAQRAKSEAKRETGKIKKQTAF
jgi:hypothetical protein